MSFGYIRHVGCFTHRHNGTGMIDISQYKTAITGFLALMLRI